jgi:hypothetical protein
MIEKDRQQTLNNLPIDIHTFLTFPTAAGRNFRQVLSTLTAVAIDIRSISLVQIMKIDRHLLLRIARTVAGTIDNIR